jgi:hypothetical protein
LAKKIDSIFVDQGYHLTRYQANIPTVRLSRPDKNGDNADFLYGYYTTIGFSNTSKDVNLLLVNIMGTTCYYLTHNDSSNNDKDIMVKTDRFDEWHSTNDKLEGEIPITVGAEYEGKFYFNLLYEIERNPETLAQWQIETYKWRRGTASRSVTPGRSRCPPVSSTCSRMGICQVSPVT